MDKNIQTIFFSKENISSLNKKLLDELKLQNVSVEVKKEILQNLVENMTGVWNTIDKTKINNNNFNNIFSQFNNYSLQNSLKKLKTKYNSNFTGIPVNQPISQPSVPSQLQKQNQQQHYPQQPKQHYPQQPKQQQYPQQQQQYPQQQQQYPQQQQQYPQQQQQYPQQQQQYPQPQNEQQGSNLSQFYGHLTPGLPDAYEDPSLDPANLKFRRDFDINKGKQVMVPDRSKSMIGGNEMYVRQSEETRRMAGNFQPGVDSMFKPLIDDPSDEPRFNEYQYQRGGDVKKQMDDIRFQRESEAYIPRKPQQNEVPDFLRPKATSIRSQDDFSSHKEQPQREQREKPQKPAKKSLKMGGDSANEFLSGMDGNDDLMSLDNFDRPITDDTIEEDNTPFAERLNRLKADRDTVSVPRKKVDFQSENFEDTYDDVEPTSIKDLKNRKKVRIQDVDDDDDQDIQRRNRNDEYDSRQRNEDYERQRRQLDEKRNRQINDEQRQSNEDYDERRRQYDEKQRKQQQESSQTGINVRELYNSYVKLKKEYEIINEENLKLKIDLETKPTQKGKKISSEERKEYIGIFNDLKKINEKLADELKNVKTTKIDLEKEVNLLKENKMPPELVELDKVKKDIQNEFLELTKHKQETENKIKEYEDNKSTLENKKLEIDTKIKELESKQIEYKKVIDEYNKLPQVKLYQMEICNENNSSYYTYNFDQLDNVHSIKLLNYSIPNNIFNIEEDKNNAFEFQFDDEDITEINLETGKYVIDDLITALNKNNFGLLFEIDQVTQKVVVNSTKNFKIIPSPLSIIVLGFTENNYNNKSEYKASKMYDLRSDNKVLLYLNNINSQTPFAVLIPNSTSPALINFEEPISLNKLDILFKDSKGRIHNFYNLEHSVSLQIEVKN